MLRGRFLEPARVIKLFFVVIDASAYQAGVFSHLNVFEPRMMFANRARKSCI